jgi:hypothetical protein
MVRMFNGAADEQRKRDAQKGQSEQARTDRLKQRRQDFSAKQKGRK